MKNPKKKIQMTQETTKQAEVQEVSFKIETLKKGEYINKISKNGRGTRCFIVAGYCRYNKAYQIDACDDISVYFYLKKGTKVLLEN